MVPEYMRARVPAGCNDGRAMNETLRAAYHVIIPREVRDRLYKLRNPGEFEALRHAVYPSDKGTFSLRGFDRYHCIFVHIPKTAGISVATALFGELPGHRDAYEYRLIYGKKTFERYFKFTFVRNPWSRLLSAYNYLKSGGWNADDEAWAAREIAPYRDFEAFVMEWLTPENVMTKEHFRPQYTFVCDHRGRLEMDFVGHLETIEKDFAIVAERLGIDAALGCENRGGEADYTAWYTEPMKRVVADVYGRDIAMFGYEFSGMRTPVGS